MNYQYEQICHIYHPHQKDGGRYCFQFVCQFTSRGRGVPQSGLGRVPHPRSDWGGTPSQVWLGGTPSQVWPEGYPGYPLTRSGWGNPPPHDQVWMEYPPDLRWGTPQHGKGYPPGPEMRYPLDMGQGTPPPPPYPWTWD